MATREVPIDLELKSFSSAAQDLKLNDQQAADVKEESMPSIPTPSVLSLQEETNLDNIAKTSNNNKGVDSDAIENANVSAGTHKVADNLENDIILENQTLHQVV